MTTCTHGQLARQCPICERDALRDAVPFAIGAIEDAIYLDDGLDGDTGQRVVHILREALESGTFNRAEYGLLPRPHVDVTLDAVRAALGMDADDEGNPVENIESIQAERDRLAIENERLREAAKDTTEQAAQIMRLLKISKEGGDDVGVLEDEIQQAFRILLIRAYGLRAALGEEGKV